MKVNCLSCGHKVDIDDSYDNYEGHIKCYICGSILEIRAEEGMIKSVKFVKMAPRPSKEEVFERTL